MIIRGLSFLPWEKGHSNSHTFLVGAALAVLAKDRAETCQQILWDQCQLWGPGLLGSLKNPNLGRELELCRDAWGELGIASGRKTCNAKPIAGPCCLVSYNPQLIGVK